MSIYTKTGDKGKTSLLNGERTDKDCISLKVTGELDELNSSLGVALSFLDKKIEFYSDLLKIQKDLFKLGAEVSGMQRNTDLAYRQAGLNHDLNTDLISKKEIKDLEESIDKMWSALPELKNFILPGGSQASAHLHLARAICRRAERELVAMGKEYEIREEVYQYLNRLSDFLFALARYINFKEKIIEEIVN